MKLHLTCQEQAFMLPHSFSIALRALSQKDITPAFQLRLRKALSFGRPNRPWHMRCSFVQHQFVRYELVTIVQ